MREGLDGAPTSRRGGLRISTIMTDDGSSCLRRLLSVRGVRLTAKPVSRRRQRFRWPVANVPEFTTLVRQGDK